MFSSLFLKIVSRPFLRHIPSVLNLPNLITSARLVLTGIFIVAVSIGGTAANWVALIAFVLATISDWLDGYLARRLNLVTSLGKLLDPLADKILVASAFVYFSAKGLCPVWVTAVIIGREFLVTGLRQIAVEKGIVMAADRLGKWKTTLQLTFGITSLVWILINPFLPQGGIVGFLGTLSQPQHFISLVSLWGAFALTVLSGFNYLIKALPTLKD